MQKLDSCTGSNAIEFFDVRLHNVGFTVARMNCLLPHLPPLVGCGVTACIRYSNPSGVGHSHFDRINWWNHILKNPAPIIVVIPDMDNSPGWGSLLGEVYTNVLRAFDSFGAVMNRAVRDLSAIVAAQFSLFAGSVSVTHNYAHFIKFKTPVISAVLRISQGNLLHGDRHGIVPILRHIAAELPTVVSRLKEKEQHIITPCNSTDFRWKSYKGQSPSIEPNEEITE